MVPAAGPRGAGAAQAGAAVGGQEQRVAIARALVTDPEVVFADEPTGALDTDTGARVFAALAALTARAGAGLVVVTHDADVARRCQRIVTLRDGRIVSSAVPA